MRCILYIINAFTILHSQTFQIISQSLMCVVSVPTSPQSIVNISKLYITTFVRDNILDIAEPFQVVQVSTKTNHIFQHCKELSSIVLSFETFIRWKGQLAVILSKIVRIKLKFCSYSITFRLNLEAEIMTNVRILNNTRYFFNQIINIYIQLPPRRVLVSCLDKLCLGTRFLQETQIQICF